MYTTYHLTSAEEISTDILDSIKATFKSKPIVIIVGEDDGDTGLTEDMKAVLEDRMQEDENTYLTAKESIQQLEKSMAYRIIVSPRAQKEIENAIDFYTLYSVDAPVNFITSLKEAYERLERNPILRIRYKNVRVIKVKKFPYLLYFLVNEKQKTTRILSCFHQRRNPDKRP